MIFTEAFVLYFVNLTNSWMMIPTLIVLFSQKRIKFIVVLVGGMD